MPELPEVESVLRALNCLNPSLPGQRVREVMIVRSSVVEGPVERFAEELTGAVFNEILRHGKYLFFRFTAHCATSSRWMVLHLRMTGRLFLVQANQAVQRHTRFCLLLEDELALRFDDPRAFGRVRLVDNPQEVIARLGPDALAIGHEDFLRQLARQNRQLKQLLLDQSVVAGIGNIYADEILFRAGLHPLRLSRSLKRHERERLFIAMHKVLNQAVQAKGANIDGVFEAGSFPVAVYKRNGRPCRNCNGMIRKERISGRGTHYCPACQPAV